MKKIVALVLLLCLVLTACGVDPAPETTAPTPVPTTAPTLPSQTTAAYLAPGAEEMPLNDSDVDWGLTLAAEKVNAMGCTLRYSQSGGNPTGQLQTGTYFTVEVFDGEWKAAPNLHPDEEIGWNAIAYLIAMDDETELPEDWSFLHGPLMPGWYRIGKEVTDFRGPGDYDKAMFYAYFEITK